MLTRRAFSAALMLAPFQSSRLPQPGVRYVPTPQNVVDAMLALARVTSEDIVYDLGSGDGRFLITAAQRYGARGVGVEVDRFVLREAEDNLKRSGVADRVRFVNGDLFEFDFSDATVPSGATAPGMSPLIPVAPPILSLTTCAGTSIGTPSLAPLGNILGATTIVGSSPSGC